MSNIGKLGCKLLCKYQRKLKLKEIKEINRYSYDPFFKMGTTYISSFSEESEMNVALSPDLGG